MLAAFNIAPSQFEIREVPTPQPAPDEALIRIKASAICGSDKNEFRRERPPRIAGHEFAGVVEALGSDAAGQGIAIGDHAMAAPLIGCGHCDICARGDFGDCAQMKGAIGYGPAGGFAEYAVAPVRNLVKVSTELSFPEACLIEPAAVGVHGADRTDLEGKRCLIVGSGSVGLFVAQAAAARGATEITLADTNPVNLGIAADLGFKTVLSGSEAVPAHQMDVAYECVGGHDAPLATALEALRNHGTLVLIGSGHPAGLSTDQLVARSLTAIGSCGTSIVEMRRAQELMLAGKMKVKPLITATFPLQQMNEAFAASLTAQKVVLEP